MNFLKNNFFEKNVSQIALGVNKTGNKNSTDSECFEKQRIYFYHKAMSLGVNFFDTAELYGGGYSEEVLGLALKNKRQQNVICTKFNARNSDSKSLRLSLENSLRRLKTDYIDIYLAHWVSPYTPLEDLIDSLNKFTNEGKILSYGIGNATETEIKDFYFKNKCKPFIIENEYNLLEQDAEKEIIPFCKENDCLFMSYSPFLQGTKVEFNKDIIAIKNKYSCTTNQLMLAWVAKQNVISVVRTLNLQHLQENIDALKIDLTNFELDTISNCFRIKTSDIDIDDVDIENENCDYFSCEDAIQNKLDLIPSPELLSTRVEKGFDLPPLRTRYRNGKYQILKDFYFSEIKKYWAWKLTNKKTIKVYVFP
jgi:aryl-alcohol dehydrogenase-like predicted oxidoreductase|tara:strand:+ start:3692 stop:4789 length:1098 start_codon:yes stop_codon:yes gene_type:complete